MPPIYMDSMGSLGISTSSLVSPIMSVSDFCYSVGDTFEQSTTHEIYDVLTDEGFDTIALGYQITISITPPSKIKAVMVKGRISRIQFRMDRGDPDLVFHSRDAEPDSYLDAVYESFTSVNLSCKNFCKAVTLHLEPMPSDPTVRFRPLFDIADSVVFVCNPLGAMLKANLATKDFSIVAPEGTIRLHRAVFAANSEFFSKCVEYDNKSSINVADTLRVWGVVVDFMYERSLRSTVELYELLYVIPLAMQFIMGDLFSAATARVVYLLNANHINPCEDLVMILSLTSRLHVPDIVAACKSYMEERSHTLLFDKSFITRYSAWLASN